MFMQGDVPIFFHLYIKHMLAGLLNPQSLKSLGSCCKNDKKQVFC